MNMTSVWRDIVAASLMAALCSGQPRTPYYVTSTVAGTPGIGDDGPATEALLYGPAGVAVDKAGNLYIADTLYHRIRKVAPDGRIGTIAGDGVAGGRGDGGAAEGARIDSPVGLAFDTDGNLCILERGGTGRLRKITPDGKIRSITVGALTVPQALAIDSAGNLFIAEAGKHVIRKVAPDGKITTVAGRGSQGSAGDNALATTAALNNPQGVAVDARGNLYISDTDNHRVRKVAADGIITTVAGTGEAGFRGDNQPATMAGLDHPKGLGVDADGTLFISDSSNHRVRKVSTAGVITTVAGTGVPGFGGDGGPAVRAQFQFPAGLALGAAGNLYVAEPDNHRIRRITPAGEIATVAGSSHFRGDGGPAASATLFSPSNLAMDAGGNLYIAEIGNNRIRKLSPNGLITTVAGSSDAPGYSDGGGRATSAKLNLQDADGLAVDASGTVHFSDTYNHRVYKVTGSGQLIRVAGTGVYGDSGDGGLAINARIAYPRGLAFDKGGNLYVALGNHNRVRKIGAADGVITTIVGDGNAGTGGDDGPAAAARLDFPQGVAADAEGNIYISSRDDDRIRRVSPGGRITTIAGTGVRGGTGDGGPATSARFNGVTQIALDPSGYLYLAEHGGQRLRVVQLASGIIDSVAGTGTPGYGGDGGFAAQAQLHFPRGVAVDPLGNIYIAEERSHRVRRLTPLVASQLAVVSGDGQSGVPGAALPLALKVRVTGAGGFGVPVVTVRFSVATGWASLSSATAMTQVDGTAAVDATLGDTAGVATVTASVTGIQSVRFTLTAAPRLSARGVVGAPQSAPPVTQVSPNALVSILGEGFGPAGEADPAAGRLPVNLGGVCVQFGSQFAPILRVAARQIDVQVPALAAPGETTVRVAANCGKPEEIKTEAQPVAVLPATPEFFYWVRNPSGQNPIRAQQKESGAYVGAPDLIPGEVFSPARPGDLISLIATGFGLTDPPVASGEAPAAEAPLPVRPAVALGGVELPAENVVYAGVHPGAPGVYRLDIRLPEDAPEGDLPVTVRVGDASSPGGGYLTVKRQ
jgi:uncharacterized protein (TIGR03437 family)